MAREKLIIAYTLEDLTEIFPKKFYKVEYANPRFFKLPKHTADFVYSDRQNIVDAYEDLGIPAIYADEKEEEVEPKSPEDVQQTVVEPAEPEPEPEEEDATEPEPDQEVEEDNETPDIEDMNAAELKAYVKDVTGKIAKTKAEALDLLKGE